MESCTIFFLKNGFQATFKFDEGKQDRIGRLPLPEIDAFKNDTDDVQGVPFQAGGFGEIDVLQVGSVAGLV